MAGCEDIQLLPAGPDTPFAVNCHLLPLAGGWELRGRTGCTGCSKQLGRGGVQQGDEEPSQCGLVTASNAGGGFMRVQEGGVCVFITVRSFCSGCPPGQPKSVLLGVVGIVGGIVGVTSSLQRRAVGETRWRGT